MGLFDTLGSDLGDWFASAFQAAMIALWTGALDLLRAAFGLANQFSVFTVSSSSGPIGIVWPMMLWISGMLALGLFFWQLTTTNLSAGRGFIRIVTGPIQYGIALAATVGLVSGFLAAADGLTTGLLTYGLRAQNFSDALNHTGLAGAAVEGVQSIVLGICAIIGVVPAAVGYVLEMLFREAAIYVLGAAIPIAAAGLLANVTARWFWRTVRWLLAAIVMKPVLALTLVLGVAVVGGAQGIAGLLAGVGVLVISLIAPFVLFRLFAFMDPNSDAGSAFRDFLAGTGVDSYGRNNPASKLASVASGGSAMEDANTGRFDQALADGAGETMSDAEFGDAPEADHESCEQSGPDSNETASGDDDDWSPPSDSDSANRSEDDNPPEPPADGAAAGGAEVIL